MASKRIWEKCCHGCYFADVDKAGRHLACSIDEQATHERREADMPDGMCPCFTREDPAKKPMRGWLGLAR